jgi:endonuclease I
MVDSGYWKGVDLSGQTIGNAFRASLQNIMIEKGTKTGTNSYDALNSILAASDRLPSGGVAAFYRNDEAAGSWNKEHVWPNSRGAGENQGFAGTDPQVIRPTNSSDNSSRSSYMYAERENPSDKAYWNSGWDPAAFGYEGARGEAARIIFYAATRYYNLSTAGAGGTSHGSTPLNLAVSLDNDSSAHLMGKLDDMLRWNAKYPVTRAEIYRNDYLGGIDYARNPFIDHPEWVNFIWDTTGIRSGSYTPSSSSYSSSSSNTPSSETSSSSSSTSVAPISVDQNAVAILPSTSGMPTQYPTSETTYTVNGLALNFFETAVYSGVIQFHKSDGYILNAGAFTSKLSSIEIAVSGGSAPTVSYGDTIDLGKEATPTGSGTYTYTLGDTGASYFKMANGSANVIKASSITLHFLAA